MKFYVLLGLSDGKKRTEFFFFPPIGLMKLKCRTLLNSLSDNNQKEGQWTTVAGERLLIDGKITTQRLFIFIRGPGELFI